MEGEMDLSGEEDPTERMSADHRKASAQQEKARERAEDSENLRGTDHNGEMQTEDFDVQEALSKV